MRSVVQKQFSFLTGNKRTDWQYSGSDNMVTQKAEHDKWVEGHKLEHAVVNKYDSFTGKPFVDTKLN